MVVSIHQPNYIPYLGYFYKMAKSDVFVFLDDVQFSKGAVHNWNNVNSKGGPVRMSIPVSHHMGDLINEVECTDGLRWKRKHLRTLEMNYVKAPYFEMVYEGFKAVLNQSGENLAELNENIILWMKEGFGLRCEVKKSSEMNIVTAKEERVIDIVSTLGGDVYYSGNGAAVYQKEQHFAERGIKLVYSDYRPVPYPQIHGYEFTPNLSALDYVMNCGFDSEIFSK